MPITHPTSVVQSTELPSLSTDRHLVYPLKASFAPLKRGDYYIKYLINYFPDEAYEQLQLSATSRFHGEPSTLLPTFHDSPAWSCCR